MLCDPDYRDVLAELRQSPEQRPVSRLDSHPTLTQRLAALTACAAAPAGSAGSARPAPAIDLLAWDERQSVGRDLRREMFRPGIASVASARLDLPWQEWVSTAARLRATAPAADLISVAGRLAGLDTATLDTVLDLLAAGRGADLAGCARPGQGRPAGHRARCAGWRALRTDRPLPGGKGSGRLGGVLDWAKQADRRRHRVR